MGSIPQRGTDYRDVNGEGTTLRTCALGVEGGDQCAQQIAASVGEAARVAHCRDAAGQGIVAAGRGGRLLVGDVGSGGGRGNLGAASRLLAAASCTGLRCPSHAMDELS